MTNVMTWGMVVPPTREVSTLSAAKLTWLGTAGFRIRDESGVSLVDPFLSGRSAKARPAQPLEAADMADADRIFVSHGHFDHIADVPSIVAVSGARVFCSGVARDTLLRLGVPASLVTVVDGGKELDLGPLRVSVFPTSHIRFDRALILRTAPRVLRLRNVGLLGEVSGKPAGPVLVFRFDTGGASIVHMGSLGIVPEEAGRYGLKGADVLLPALQGHTHICSMAARVTAAVGPRAVVPQHFDDFFPPVSQWVELMPFEAMVARLSPGTKCHRPEINREFDVSVLLDG